MWKLRILYIVLFIVTALYSCSENDPLRTGLEGKPIPNFSILLKDSSTFVNTAELATKKPFVLLYFSSHCPHCKDQIQDIVDNISSLHNIEFLFVTKDSKQKIEEIYNKYNLAQYKNITLGNDTGYSIAQYYGAFSVPYLAIYNKDMRLMHAYLGKMSTSQIRNVTESN